MVKTWLMLAVCTPAVFGASIAYNYTGNTFTVCNGATSINGNCPANVFSDRILASATFSSPLGANLSSANEASSVVAWTMGDALGLTPSFSSLDANAAAEFQGLVLSTNGVGGISAWGMVAETAGFFLNPTTFLPGGTFYGINNPTFIGGSGFPNADDLIGNGGNTNSAPGGGWNVSSGLTGTWTETLNGFQGGTTAAPVFLLSGSPVAGVSGSIGGQGAQEYYGFYWAGGAFSATASITGASGTASYLFSEGLASGFCGGGASSTLNSVDSFTSTIGSADLAPGQYCIGIDANSPNDPNFSITFNTPVSAVPEPSGLILLSAGLGMIRVLRRAKRV